MKFSCLNIRTRLTRRCLVLGIVLSFACMGSIIVNGTLGDWTSDIMIDTETK